MGLARTTRCCSAVALTLAIAANAEFAAAPSPPKALPFFPTRAVWSLTLNNPLTQSPAYDATRAFFPIAGDRLVAYDLKTGTLAWTVAAAPTMALTAGDNLIFFPEKDELVALRTADGARAWHVRLDEPLGVSPVWDNGWLVLATARGTVIAMSARDGRVIWRRDIGTPLHARPALSADRVYVPLSNTHVAALAVETGNSIWDKRLGGDPNDILALDDRIYVGSKDRYLYCIDAARGTVEWRSMRTGADVVGVPTSDDDRVYFVSLDNILRAVSRGSGVQQWMRPLPFRPSSGPIRAGATIIAAGPMPSLPTFNAKDGTPVGTLPTVPEPAAPPHLVIDSASGLPLLVILTGDIAKGVTVSLLTRGIDPAPAPVGTLPGAITTLPTVSSPAAPSGLPEPRQD
ncbi:MAG TPA: PQQ-binding-like beta-propeller repeat protein [Vicinamibacterales bacterium]|nr:PQQ-binding-like beta-propeller repeat protein [Vicinamibacterales bacterium]